MPNTAMQTAAWIRIGPDLAQDYLELRADRQRKLSVLKIHQYAKDMTEGRWHEHGQPIQFDVNGQLIDGQHRLEAIIVSGKTVKLLVVRGISPESFAYVDIGMRRVASQFVAGERRADIVYAADWLRIYEMTDGTFRNWASHKATLSIDDTMSYIAKHPEIEENIRRIEKVYRACKIHRGSHAALLCLAGATEYYDLTDEWCRGLAEGSGLDAGDPRLVLRERWIRDGRSLNLGGGKVNANLMRWSYLVKAWNAFAEGRTIALLRHNFGEDVPDLVGL